MWCYISDQTSFLLGKKLISIIVFQPNKMKWSLIGRISFHLLTYKSLQRSLISFGNTSYQTNERKYSEDFQSKLISVNSDNQTSFQLFYWNENFIGNGYVCLGKFSQYFLSFVWLDIVFKGNFQEFPGIINFLWKNV